MKKIYSFIIVFCFFNTINSQIITIPDTNFKAKLISLGVDINNDGNIQQSEALLKTNLNISLSNITDLTGINYFSNLTNLSFSNNNVTNLTPLNGLTNLVYLYFWSNNVTTFVGINNLPSLTNIDCSSNPLTNLIGLSNIPSLERLTCGGILQISLIGINTLANLRFLSCIGCNLTSLSNINSLSGLETLFCSYNPGLDLSSINSMVNLKQLSCRGLSLTNLNMISGLINLTYLDISDNNFSSVNLSNYTLLTDFICNNNYLYSLNVTLNPNLWRLYCTNNNLTSLDISSLTQLRDLSCSENNITTLNLNNNNDINGLYCSGNNLTSIDVSNLSNLSNLYCKNMPSLISINMKNGSTNYDNFNPPIDFSNNPNLTYVCADDAVVPMIQSEISGYPNCHVNSYCSFVPSGSFYTIQGNNKYDSDNNGCNGSDINYPNLKLLFTNGVVSANLVSDSTGNYHYDVQASTQTISPVIENPTYFNISPSSSTTVSFPSSASPFIRNFCISPNGTHNDLEVTLAPTNSARPGFDATYVIIFKNKGTHLQSGSVNFTFNDAIIDFVSAIPTASSQVLNSLIWNFVNLQPFETRQVFLTLNLNSPIETPAVNIGYNLNYSAVINGLTDINPNDNTSVLHQIVVGSLDPNDKQCLEGISISPSMVGQYVHYIIRFENTGTFAAENVVVKDMIDTTKFVINSLIPLSSNYSFVTRITNNNKVEFIFENINLPFDDANNDGYVAFKIKTKPTLVVGDTFSNNASIYFDYNFPIVTNTATTTIQALGNTDFEFNTYFTLAPNPAKDVLRIQSSQSVVISSLSIYNTIGQLVLVVTEPTDLIDVSTLKTGNYFIKIVSNKGTTNTKFLKE